MQIPAWLIFGIGFLAQMFFAARTLFQWITSERSRRVVSPASYWIFSVLGACTMFIYGELRDDFAIILGQLASYYIYLWNLNAKEIWKKMGLLIRLILLATPVLAVVFHVQYADDFLARFLRNGNIPLRLVLFGSSGQIIFTLRFIYQWFYSFKRHQSVLPAGFWIISLVGSGTIIAYGIIRKDPVLILGQSFGFVAYCRNLTLWYREKRKNVMAETHI